MQNHGLNRDKLGGDQIPRVQVVILSVVLSNGLLSVGSSGCQSNEELFMKTRFGFAVVAISLLAASSASAQIVSGVMTVTGAEMH